ncbi:hypothetical protein [Sphingomonas gellani]|uniref:hypothetical protein n=1 Tax=Sphingomonas gellani TaxID=1166340 RepID=UPI001BB0B9B3|nr:hypothetical protein [Sphingomonas gellani]
MINRRDILGSSLAVWASAGIAAPAKLIGRLKQSVSRWCYQDIPLERLCAFAASIGLQGIDLLEPADYEVPRRHGLRCTMGYAAGIMTIPDGLNRRENHAAIEQAYRKGIPQAAKGRRSQRHRLFGQSEGHVR